MKTKIFFLLLFLTSILSKSQNDYEVREHSLIENPLVTSFTIEVIGTGESLAINNWQKFIESHKGTSYVMSYGEGDIEIKSEHVVFPFFDNQLVTIHSRFSPNSDESGVLMTIWIQMNDGSYYDPKTEPNSSLQIKKWLLNFRNTLADLNRTH